MGKRDFESSRQLRERIRTVLLGTLAAGVLGAGTVSAEVLFGAQAGVGHSDNITRVETQEIDETIGTVAVDLTWREQRRRLDADVAVDLAYFDYLDNTYSSEVVGTANGTLLFAVVPERFTWLVQDSFGQAQVDPFAAVTPETRENVNYFTTGPDAIFRFGSVAALRLFGRYSVVHYEDSPLDSQRLMGGLSLGRQLSPRSELALNAATESIEFDDQPAADYDRHHAYLSYRIEGARGNIAAELGYTWLDRAGDDSSGGALARLDVTRNLSAASMLVLSLGTRMTDASDALRTGVAGEPVGGGVAVTATADPFENRFASAEWRFSKHRTELSLGASWNDDRYEELRQLNRTRWVYAARFSRELSRTLTLRLLADLADEEFDETGFDAEELRGGVMLSWRFGRNFGLNLLGERVDRSTSNGVGEFVENRAFLTLTYRPTPATL